MKTLTYTAPGRFDLFEKPKPVVLDPKDAVVKVTLSSICSSDLHILHGAVPQAEVGITVGHELVGVVEAVGSKVTAQAEITVHLLKPVGYIVKKSGE